MSNISLLSNLCYKKFSVKDIRYKIIDFNHVEIIEYLGNKTDIVIPEIVVFKNKNYTVNSIGKFAFKEKKIKNVFIPNSVVKIKAFAFVYNEITKLNIPDSISIIEEGAFANNKLITLNISNNLKFIEDFTFVGNQLKYVVVPGNVVNMGDYVFYDNPITKIISLSKDPVQFTNKTFANSCLISLIVPIESTRNYMSRGWVNFYSIDEALC